MTGSGSPCGACKFLRRKCVRGCVFAPYFCHEEGANNFGAIHRVFGASNVSKILAHLPVTHRCQAAVTISYEAQARIQDPIYGCVSHIFALQHQVVSLQAQLASLKEQAANCIINSSNNNDNIITSNPNDDEKIYGEGNFSPHDFQSWPGNHDQMLPVFDANYNDNNDDIGPNLLPYYSSGGMDCIQMSPSLKYDNSCFREDHTSFGSMDSIEMQYPNDQNKSNFSDDAADHDLESVAFRYINHKYCF